LWTREPSNVACQALNDEEYEKRIQFISQTLKQIGKQSLQEGTRAVQMDDRSAVEKSLSQVKTRPSEVEVWKQTMDQVAEVTKETQEELRKQIQESKECLGQGASRWMDSWRGRTEEATKQLEQDAVKLHKEVQKEVKNQVGQTVQRVGHRATKVAEASKQGMEELGQQVLEDGKVLQEQVETQINEQIKHFTARMSDYTKVFFDSLTSELNWFGSKEKE